MYTLVNNLDIYLKIKKSAANWRESHSIYSHIWDPKLVNKTSYLKEFLEHQAFVLFENKIPVAGVVLSKPSEYKNDAWVKDLGSNYHANDCLYIDDLAVIETRIGTGVIEHLLSEIETYAKREGFHRLRLDFDKSLDKLHACYIKHGFVAIAEHALSYRTSLYMEKSL